MGRSLSTIRTKQLRVVPVEKSVDGSQAVAPYNSVRELVGGAKDIVVTDCICQKEQRLLGHTCDKPEETCLAFGDFARFYRDNGMGRPVTREEALAILDRAEAHGLVLSPSNTQELAALCCCCTCCCPVLKFARMMPRPADRVLSHYRAAIDPELCAACGDCLERCPMEAIEEGEAASRVLAQRCIGCGLCASACPEGAIAMEAKPGMEAPPKDFDEVMRKIAAERGKAS
jgi:ferredoxin